MTSKNYEKLTPQSKQTQNQLKTEFASDTGSASHEKIDMGNLTSRQIGNLVKSMVESYEQKLK
ncbi:MAG: alpha/beta-type small acid-soluble spore protein [Bacillota bacterium]|nr:alpha/beta-type small acid-soluble spore protein [Bacillota bacterium]